MSFNPSSNSDAVSFNPSATPISGSIATEGLVGCDPSNLTRQLFDDLADQAGNLYGLKILYYRQDFDPKKAHPIYGDSVSKFLDPKELNALVDITVDSSILASLGIQTENKVDLQISYAEFEKAFGTASPQAGDKFEIKDLLCDRPSGFTRVIFEVVSQGDSDLFEVNKRWFISGERSDYTYIEGEPQEVDNKDIFDSEYAGPVDVNTHEPILDDPKGQTNAQETDIEELASKDFKEEDSEAYGGYYSDDGIFFDM